MIVLGLVFISFKSVFLVSVKLLQNVWTLDNASFLRGERERASFGWFNIHC